MASTGKISYSEPRAVLVRSPENLKEVHSTIGTSIHIEVDTREEGQLIMDLLPDLLSEMNDKIKEHVDAAFLNGR